MKIGDKIPVTIAGQEVANAEVRELADGTVTLVFPATRVVMATRTELTTAPVNTDTTGAQHIIDSVERQSAPVVETPETPAVGDAVNNIPTTQDGPASPSDVITSTGVPTPTGPLPVESPTAPGSAGAEPPANTPQAPAPESNPAPAEPANA